MSDPEVDKGTEENKKNKWMILNQAGTRERRRTVSVSD